MLDAGGGEQAVIVARRLPFEGRTGLRGDQRGRRPIIFAERAGTFRDASRLCVSSSCMLTRY
ncbi:MAG TPA: hypothetical protein VHC19_01840, partial [Pirellulales bacterium]|nr:hypothetical protein [Pirellulales bacterium]